MSASPISRHTSLHCHSSCLCSQTATYCLYTIFTRYSVHTVNVATVLQHTVDWDNCAVSKLIKCQILRVICFCKCLTLHRLTWLYLSPHGSTVSLHQTKIMLPKYSPYLFIVISHIFLLYSMTLCCYVSEREGQKTLHWCFISAKLESQCNS